MEETRKTWTSINPRYDALLDQLRESLQALDVLLQDSPSSARHTVADDDDSEIWTLDGYGSYDLASQFAGLAAHRNESRDGSAAPRNAEDRIARRSTVQTLVYQNPYDVALRLALSNEYAGLGYPDLAVGEAYRALLLVDEVLDDSGEYHELAYDALRQGLLDQHDAQGVGQRSSSVTDDAVHTWASWFSELCYRVLVDNLMKVGCLRTATEMCVRLLKKNAGALRFRAVLTVLQEFSDYCVKEGLPVDLQRSLDNLPDSGLARRELYPWNDHEPDRSSVDALKLLNEWMRSVAPRLEVRATELPDLTHTDQTQATVKQLGVFAKQDLAPGEVVLDELSLLTACSRLNDTFCDACSGALVVTDSPSDDSSVACEECQEAVFCTRQCRTLAQESYHPALCERDVFALSRDAPPKEAADALYSLLLLRTFAMSMTQDLHPLDLKEVKYIWGDYVAVHSSGNKEAAFVDGNTADTGTLPFSFKYNILLPLNMLEQMDINVFDTDGRYDTWVFNTLYAKFRGTASAKQGRDGRPEIGAVHPLWCLANHSCDPDVTWSWEGSIKLCIKEQRERWAGKADGERAPPGVKRGQEVLNHYCDVTLPVQERREWAVGALGGICQCNRCRWEDGVRTQASQ